jgi:cytoskeletal protein RodZ
VALVLILFIIVTAVLVGQVHPTSSVTGTSATTTTTAAGSSTTVAGGSSTSTTSRSSTSTTKPKSTSTTTTTTTPPASVPVLVANGSTVTGAASKVATELHANGWDTLPPVNTTANVTASSVYYAPGSEASAMAIAASLALAATAVHPLTTAVPVASVAGADVVVVVGPDIAGKSVVVTPTTAAPATTTTTKAH